MTLTQSMPIFNKKCHGQLQENISNFEHNIKTVNYEVFYRKLRGKTENYENENYEVTVYIHYTY